MSRNDHKVKYFRHRGKSEHARKPIYSTSNYLNTIREQAKSLAYQLRQVKEGDDISYEEIEENRGNIKTARDISKDIRKTLYNAEKVYKNSYELGITSFPEIKNLSNDISSYLSQILKADVMIKGRNPIGDFYRWFKSFPSAMSGIPTPRTLKYIVNERKNKMLLRKAKSKASELEHILMSHKEKPRKWREILYIFATAFSALAILAAFILVNRTLGYAVFNIFPKRPIFGYLIVLVLLFIVFILIIRFLKPKGFFKKVKKHR